MTVQKTHIFLVVWGAVEVVLFGGIIFGWASLVYIYKQEGFFVDHCTSQTDTNNSIQNIILTETLDTNGHPYSLDTTTQSTGSNISTALNIFEPHRCLAQDKLFNLIYVLAAVVNGVASFPNGVIWDKYGTRVMRVVGAVTFIPGVLLAAFVTQDTALLLFPAMILIAYGGYIILMTNFQLGSLIPSRKSMIISLYCGAYDSSAFMLVLIKWAYSAGLAPRYAFTIMLMLYVVYIISTLWYMPKNRIPFPLPEGYKMDLKHCHQMSDKDKRQNVVKKEDENESEILNKESSQNSTVHSGKMEREFNSETKVALEIKAAALESDVSFLKEAVSMLFIWDMIWLTLMRLQSWSFVGRLNPALERLSGGDQSVVSQYTSVYACMQFFGILLAPLSGRLMDRKKNRKVDPKLKRIEMIEVCIASFIIDNTCGLLLAITMTIPVLEVQYISFVFHVIHRALLYGPNSAFIAQAFSAHNFGKLFGLVMTVSAAVSLIQFPLFILVQGPLDGDPLMFNILIFILMIVAYGHPIYLTLWCRKQRKIYNENKNLMIDNKVIDNEL